MGAAARDLLKYAIYRTPLFRFFAPRYPYYLNPAELAFLCDAISLTRETGGSIIEIGVAKGDTSIFLLEHLRTTQDDRSLHLIDTFSGFTQDSLEYEIRNRAKAPKDMGAFRYGDQAIFEQSLRQRGYSSFRSLKADAARVDYSQFAPIAVVLLDIDLYLPTKAVLEAISPHMARPGFILVDDCRPDTPWDGALLAYREFIEAHGHAPVFIGEKGGVIRLGA
jgi:O-methyltransferase